MSDLSRDFKDLSSELVSVDEMWDDFSCRVNKPMEQDVPTKLVTPHKKVPGFNRTVARTYRKKKKAFIKAKHSNTTEDWEIFQSLRKLFNRESRHNYRKYVRDTCVESMKKFYSFIKSLKRDSFGIPSLRSEGRLISENVRRN